MDCGFLTMSLLAALACVGLAALGLELWRLLLCRKLSGRIFMRMEVDCSEDSAGQRVLYLLAAQRLRRLLWPGAQLQLWGLRQEDWQEYGKLTGSKGGGEDDRPGERAGTGGGDDSDPHL